MSGFVLPRSLPMGKKPGKRGTKGTRGREQRTGKSEPIPSPLT